MMGFDSTEFATIISSVVAILGALITLGIKGINMARNALNKKTENAVLQTLINSVSDNAINVVKALNQTVVDDLKAKTEDGKLTKDEIASIKNTALSTLKSTLSSESQQTISHVFGDLDTYLKTLIEAKVNDVKNGKDVVITDIVAHGNSIEVK